MRLEPNISVCMVLDNDIGGFLEYSRLLYILCQTFDEADLTSQEDPNDPRCLQKRVFDIYQFRPMRFMMFRVAKLAL